MVERIPKAFREAVLHHIDWAYDNYDGETPDHIIVSNEIWSLMKTHNAFEKLRRNTAPKRRASAPGYVGMRVWHSAELDRRDKHAMLLSEEVFSKMYRQVKDYEW